MKRFFWLMLIALLPGCEGFLGDKTDLDFIDVPEFQNREIAYVPILPVITSDPDPNDTVPFRPTDIVAGFDELIYVLDEGYNRVVSYDQGGRQVGAFAAPPNVTFEGALVQDRTLDLLVLGRRDTVIQGLDYSLATIFRLELKQQAGYGLNFATIQEEITHPFYLTATPNLSDQNVSFRGVAVLPDNRFYVTRTGPRTDNVYGGGPEDAVLLFDSRNDRFTPISVATSGGTFRDFFRDPAAITTYTVAPQQPVLGGREGFFVTVFDPDATIRVRRIDVVGGENGISYESAILPATGDTTEADGFIYEPNKFERPVDITVTGDGTNFLFVADAARDSVYQFDARGFEGVPPPPGSLNPTKVVRVSFGGGGGETNFQGPTGVAYLDEILYVTDLLPGESGRILRFRLTTDFE